jgi:peptide/nickel transport system ATP-binding protein
VPRLDARVPPVPVPGTAPAPGTTGPGCPFAPRCPLAEPECHAAEPPLTGVDNPSRADASAPEAHEAACRRIPEVRHRTAAELFGPPTETPDRHRTPGGPAAEQAAPPPSGAGTAEPTSDMAGDRARGTTRGTPPAAPAEAADDLVLSVSGLGRSYPAAGSRRRGPVVRAVEQVDLEVRRGQTLALVGESGAGKSTTLREIASLAAPQAGRVEVLGQDTALLSRRAARELRTAVQLVPQDPMSSLDPRMPVGDIVAEPLHAARVPAAVVAARVPRLLSQVGLRPADADGYPHQFSGGQRQRIAIARALAVGPALLLLDEPVSALDVSVQAGILDLLLRLKRQPGPAYLLVSHDLAVVRQLADRVSVMYAGRTVETGSVAEVYGRPHHPYTRALLSAVPLPDPVAERARRRIVLPGDPGPGPPGASGCGFRARCPVQALLSAGQRRRCAEETPRGRAAGPDAGHTVSCHFPPDRRFPHEETPGPVRRP